MSFYTDTIKSTPGLVGHWPLDEASGNAIDRSAGGHNGTFTGTVTRATRTVAGFTAPDFGGGYVNLGDASVFSAPGLTGTLSVECWVNLDSVTGTVRMLVAKGGSSNHEWDMRMQTDGTPMFTTAKADGSNAVLESAGAALSVGQAYHLLGTYNRNAPALNLYVNGVLIATDTSVGLGGQMSDGNAPVLIGERSDGGGDPVDGSVAQVAIYSRALTAVEAAWHYRVGLLGLAALWSGAAAPVAY